MIEKYGYCITVPRTFVHDDFAIFICLSLNFTQDDGTRYF